MVTLNKPSAGDTNWYQPVTDNWTEIESSVDQAICQGRLTLTSGTPVTTNDVTAAGTLYFTPYKGNRVAIYDGTTWKVYTLSEISLALTLTSGKNYDVFIYSNSGTLTLELSAAWAGDTSRTDALTTQDGIKVKSADNTRRFLGTLRASAANQCDDSATKRFLANYYNRLPKRLFSCPGYSNNNAVTTYTKTAGNWGEANSGTASKVEFISNGEDTLDVSGYMGCTSIGGSVRVGIGVDSNSSPTVDSFSGNVSTSQNLQCGYKVALSDGYHFADLLVCAQGGTATIAADDAQFGAGADPYLTMILGSVFV